MGVIPKDVKDAASAAGGGNKFIKAEEFEGNGLLLKVVSFAKIKSKNAKFGANEKDALHQQKILGDGETFRYVFSTVLAPDAPADQFPEERVIESKSLALFIAFSQCDPEPGQQVRIRKEGKMEETRYTVEVEE